MATRDDLLERFQNLTAPELRAVVAMEEREERGTAPEPRADHQAKDHAHTFRQ